MCDFIGNISSANQVDNITIWRLIVHADVSGISIYYNFLCICMHISICLDYDIHVYIIISLYQYQYPYIGVTYLLIICLYPLTNTHRYILNFLFLWEDNISADFHNPRLSACLVIIDCLITFGISWAFCGFVRSTLL